MTKVFSQFFFANGNCSNIGAHPHVASIDLVRLMKAMLSQVRLQYIFNHSSWFPAFGQAKNRDSQKGQLLALDLAFDSKSLRNICENEQEAIRELGPSVSEVLKHRLADLRAALSVKDLLVGRPRELAGGIHHQHMAIDLRDEYQMIFCANHPSNPIDENGKLDWSRVSRIKILRIERNYVE